MNEFVMRRTEHSETWKNLNVSIDESGLRNKSSITLEQGVQMSSTEYNALLYEWNKERGTLLLLNNKFIIDKSMTVTEIKLKILQQHQQQWTLPSSQYKKLRLRNCVELSNRVGKAWCNHLTLANEGNGPASTRLKDDVELCIELLAEEEELTENSLLITVQQWHPDLQTLADSQELVMFATDTLGDLKIKLSHMGSVAVGNIAVGKPFAWQLKDPKINLPHIKWDFISDVGELKKDMRLDHGSVLVYKNNTLKEIVLMAEEEEKSSGGRGGGGGGGGIKIYTFSEQLQRAAAAKQLKVEQKLMEDRARQEMEERMKAAKEGEVVGGTDNSQ
jgi:hypothetical protein